MNTSVLWIWDPQGELLYEGPFSGDLIKSGKAYRYKHLCSDGIKEGYILTQKMIENAIIFDDADLIAPGTITVEFSNAKT